MQAHTASPPQLMVSYKGRELPSLGFSVLEHAARTPWRLLPANNCRSVNVETPARGRGFVRLLCAVPVSSQLTPGAGDRCGFELLRVKDANVDSSEVSDRGGERSPDLVFTHHLHSVD